MRLGEEDAAAAAATPAAVVVVVGMVGVVGVLGVVGVVGSVEVAFFSVADLEDRVDLRDTAGAVFASLVEAVTSGDACLPAKIKLSGLTNKPCFCSHTK